MVMYGTPNTAKWHKHNRLGLKKMPTYFLLRVGQILTDFDNSW